MTERLHNGDGMIMMVPNRGPGLPYDTNPEALAMSPAMDEDAVSVENGELLQEEKAELAASGGSVPTPDDKSDERETWGSKVDFLLSVIGFAVDLANVWRFPYLCYKNGGGAFLIPYCLMLFLGGIPLFYMELALGQFYRKGPITCWGTLTPVFKGIGWCVILIALYTDFFYNVIISWALYFFFASFTSTLPWTECNPDWMTPRCFDGHLKGEEFPLCTYKARMPVCDSWINYLNCTASGGEMATTAAAMGSCADFSYPNTTLDGLRKVYNMSSSEYWQNVSNYMLTSVSQVVTLNDTDMSMFCSVPDRTSPAEEYFQRSILGVHHTDGQGLSAIGPIRWQNTLCLLAVYLICYFSLWRGITTSGKVVWFTAIFPYVVLFILLIRGVTLDGADIGIAEYLKPDFSMLNHAQVWVDAATQVFFSLGPGFGVLLAFSSYNKFHNNVYRDALATSAVNCCTSFLAGFVIFSILGYMAKKTCKEFYDVATEGPGLVFIVYPEALATLPGSTLWAIIFFLMLLTLGLDSSFGGSEAILTGLTDEFPVLKKKRKILVGVLFGCYFLVGLASCTHGGVYVVHLFDRFAAGYSILFAVLCETIAVSWVYGVFRFANDIKKMIGSRPGYYWIICWALAAPVFITFIIIFGLVSYQPLTFESYEYPTWAIGIGWTVALSSILCIPVMAVYQTLKHKGDRATLFNGWWTQAESYTPEWMQGLMRRVGLGGMVKGTDIGAPPGTDYEASNI